MRIRRSTFKKILQEELGSAVVKGTDGGLGEQVTFAEYTSQNFDICPGAVKAFVRLKDLVSEQDEVAVAEDAMESVDDLLGIEKDALAKGFATEDEFDQILNLAGHARVKIGQLGALMGKSVAQDFSFINQHIMTVAKMLEGRQDED